MAPRGRIVRVIARLNVGTFVRDYFDSGPLSCGVNNYPIYSTRPTDPRSAYIYEVSGNSP